MAFGKPKSETKSELPLFGIVEEGGLYRAVCCRDGVSKPLASPYGEPMERRAAAREASNALYRFLVLGIEAGQAHSAGISPAFKITGR
jgi:hypothetical protein